MLAEAAGISVGLAGDMGGIRTRGVRGRMPAAEALDRLLAGTGYRAVAITRRAYRIERARGAAAVPAAPRAAAPAAVAAPAPASVAEIVVTGQKRRQMLSEVAMSIAVTRLDGFGPAGVTAGSRDLALGVEGLSLTNLGPGRNRQFIRGVADSPFNGPSQSTVAVQIDEARATFDAPDPDLRLVDVDRVEILKGPQGPLYGSGALGGIYHIVTRKPDAAAAAGSVRAIGEAVAHGGTGGGVEAMVNVPLADDRLALRAVGYALRGGGWIDDVGRKDNANASHIKGGRVALRWLPDADWTFDLTGIVQSMNVADSQYVMTSEESLRRTAPIAEPADNDFRAVGGTVQGRIGGLRLVSATSYVDQAVDFTLDATAGAKHFGIDGAAIFHDDRRYDVFNQEVRISPADGGRWLAGLSYLRATSHSEAAIEDAAGVAAPVETLDRRVVEYAAFGEATIPLLRRIEAIAGLRLFRTIAEDETVERSGGKADRFSRLFLAPSLAVSWAVDGDDIVYLRYARALRPGGLAAAEQAKDGRFDSDELGSFDLGVRHAPAGGRLSFAFSLFYTDWSHIQSDYLLGNGLISTRNAGHGRIFGGEGSIDWRPFAGLSVTAGLMVERARLIRSEDGEKVDDRRLPIAPDMTGRLAAAYDFALGPWRSSLAVQANYIGHARLTFDEDLDRRMGDYATVAISAALRHGGLTIAVRVDNLLDIRGDSFAFGNPFSIRNANQYTPLRPRTVTLSIAHLW